MKKFKKLLFVIVLTFVLSLTALMTVNKTYAYTFNINNPGTTFTDSQDGLTIEFDVTIQQGSSVSLDFDIDKSSYYVASDHIDFSYTYFGESTVSFTDLDFVSVNKFTTPDYGTPEDQVHFVININVQDPQGWDDILTSIKTNIDNYIFLSDVVADEVPPTYTYSSAEIDTPYYDLITEAEIRAQLSATDPEEGNVTSRISVYSDTYTSATKVVGGDYYIMYVVDDTAGNSAYLRIDIHVIDDKKPYMTYNSTTYQNGATINWTWYNDEWNNGTAQTTYNEYISGHVFFDENDFPSGVNPLDEEWPPAGAIYLNGAQNEADELMLIDSFGTPGTYNFTEEFTDKSGNKLVINHQVTVLTNTAPVITGPAAVNLEIYDSNLESILSNYSASDTEDGALNVTIKSTSLGMGEEWYLPTINNSMTVTLAAVDSMGHETTKDITVTMVDSTLPVFKIDNITVTDYTHNVNMSDTTTLQTLIDSIIVTDAFDGDLTSSIVVPAFPSFSVPGTTVITLTCTDPQGNQSSLDLTVNVIDDIAPVINGASKIVKGITATLTISDITAELNAVDNVDGILTLEVVSDGYSGNSAKLGSYVVKYKATDSVGNITYHDVRIWVVDNQAPAWVLNDYFVNITANQAMNRTELVALLQASGMIGNDIAYTVTFVTDDYQGNEEIAGAYQVVMNIEYTDGSEDFITVLLNVPEAAEDEDVIVVDNPDTDLSNFQKTINWIKTAFKNTGAWFSNAWNTIKSWGTWINEKIIQPVVNFFKKPTDTDIPVYTTETPVNSNTTTTITTTETPTYTTSSPFNQISFQP